ncbi:unnamed protein product [Euphydryas editha]|uniref:CHK kinase-like domain-containing protein n=1 Tax=Euphydryas editha TaxID=104508 RepID=A0AAU9UB86_EUPED|nr:unnamed protein product [Euphydryas editha]
MSDISEEYLNDVMSNVATALELKEWSFNKQTFNNIAQNYFGIIIPTVLSGKVCEKNESFSIVLKLAPTDERYRVSSAVSAMFAREIFVYSKLLNKYQDIQKSHPLSSRYVIPKCYYVCSDYCKEVIAMQNMCEEGYKPYVNSMFLDISHITIALKSLAKFHALSFILKEKASDLFEEAKKICIPLTEKSNKRYIHILTDRLIKALEKFKNTPYIALLEILKQKCVQFIEMAMNSVRCLCLCHGDMWKENLLFQYEDSKPVSACIIDYQTTRICSPAFDVLYLIVSSTTTVLRKDYFKQLLDIYYQSFEETLTQENLKPNDVYSRDMFQYDLQIVGPACLIVANTAIWLSSGLQQEGHVRSKIIPITDAEKIEAVRKYTNIITSIIDDLKNYGYLEIVFK